MRRLLSYLWIDLYLVSMSVLRHALFPFIRLLSVVFVFALTFLLVSCGDDSNGSDYSFDRTIQEPLIEKRCVAGTPSDTAECYLLQWRNPTSTEGFVAVHIWVDTTWVGSTDTEVDDKDKANSIRISADSALLADSLDITSYLKPYLDRDTIQIVIWAEFSGSGLAGRVMHSFVILGDDIVPGRVQVRDSAGFDEMTFQWTRPIDQVDFYRQDRIDGPIVGYNFVLKAPSGISLVKARAQALLSIGGVKATLHNEKQFYFDEGKISLIDATSAENEIHFAIPDGKGFSSDTLLDRIGLYIGALPSETQFEVGIDAMDSAGNSSYSERRMVSTTDEYRPLIGSRIWFASDPVDSSKARIDSNRIYIYWPLSLDPLKLSHGIVVDTALKIPTGCVEGDCFRQVSHYIVEHYSEGEWKSIREGTADEKSVERPRANLLEGQMTPTAKGLFVGDTLKWVAPGVDSIRVRIRSVDSSGAVSSWLEQRIHIGRGALSAQIQCPDGFLSVHKRAGADTTAYAVFCMEQLEHRISDQFSRNVLFSDARKACQALSGNGLTVDLCQADDWFSACSERGSSYGTLQEAPFYAHDYLVNYCNVSTGDSLSAQSLQNRYDRCVSSAGILDLPGQLQEWVLGSDSNGVLPRIKGSSYLEYDVPDPTLLAKCNALSTPKRWRPKLVRDTIYLYKNGVAIDTLLKLDTARPLYRVVAPSAFADTIYWYQVEHPSTGDSLGLDYVDAREYARRTTLDSLAYIQALAGPLKYRYLRSERLLIMRGSDTLAGSSWFYTDPSLGFRCCAVPNP